MPLQILQVSKNNNSFFAASCLSFLLPALENELNADFINHLFGRLSLRESSELVTAITTYNLQNSQIVLNHFITTKLRPRLLQHIQANTAYFRNICISLNVDFPQMLQNIETSNAQHEEFEIKALSHLLSIYTYVHISLTTQPIRYGEAPPPEQTNSIHILSSDNTYHALVEPIQLSPALRDQFFPHFTLLAEIPENHIDVAVVRISHINAIMRTMLSTLPTQVTALSLLVNQARPARNPFLHSPVDEHFCVRFNPIGELSNIRADAPSTELINRELIGSLDSWTPSMVNTFGASLGIGILTVGIETLIGEAIGAGIGLSAIPYVGIPLAVVTCLGTIVCGIVGKQYSVEFEKAIFDANRMIERSEFREAASLLDREFNRWTATKFARNFFLTNEGYSYSHFIRAVCAEQLDETGKAYYHYSFAYTEARTSGRNVIALVAQLQLIKMLKRNVRAALLVEKQYERSIESTGLWMRGRYPTELLSDEKSNESKIDSILEELTQNYKEGFSEVYWNLHDNINSIAQRLTQIANPLTTEEVISINKFLVADSFFILKYFSNGIGIFSEILSIFFQGAILAYFGYTNSEYLQEHSRSKLIRELCNGNTPIAYVESLLAIRKFYQCAMLLNNFQNQYSTFIRENLNIQTCIKFLKTFVLKFYALSLDGENITRVEYDRVIQLLNTPTQAANTLLRSTHSSIELLTILSRDFGLSFDTVESWLDALIVQPSGIVHMTSPNTGDTMLHLLVQLSLEYPELETRIKQAANILISHRYTRNRNHKTVFCLLNNADPMRLGAVLCPEPLVRLGNELDKVDNFLNRINDNLNIDSHFLLLDGPPGTGKTSSVLQHVRRLGHTVQEWERGTTDDRYVGGLVTRIQTFFANARNHNSPNRLMVLFIDEIHGVIPKAEGTARRGYHDVEQDVTTFLTAISALKGQRVVLIGATNYLDRVPDPIISRAGTNRINFPLPNESNRKKLLQHLFRFKVIEQCHLDRLAKTTVGYSPRQMQSFLDTFEETDISFEILVCRLNDYAETIKNDFRRDFSADIFMPTMQLREDIEPPSNPELREQFNRIQRENISQKPTLKHTLLYGPPGSGKTTEVRKFAQTSARVLIAINAEPMLQANQLKAIFRKAKEFGRAILFIDEMDRIACSGGHLTSILQIEMNGIVENSVTVIGATNYPQTFEPAISSRFTKKIELDKPTPQELCRHIGRAILDRITYQHFYVDTEFTETIQGDARQTVLAEEINNLELRLIYVAIHYLIEDIESEKPDNFSGIVFLRYQDLLFSFHLMKLQEHIEETEIDDIRNITQTEYIQRNKTSFFQQHAPETSMRIENVLQR